MLGMDPVQDPVEWWPASHRASVALGQHAQSPLNKRNLARLPAQIAGVARIFFILIFVFFT